MFAPYPVQAGGLAGFLPAHNLQARGRPRGREPRRKVLSVSHYTLDELIARWQREELTVEQMIGQILQLLRAHEGRLRAVERRLPASTEAA